MLKITASEVNNLRKQTGAGMMDCKNALVEANGDTQEAIDILRKKGQKVAAKRAGREAKEGVVLAAASNDSTKAYILSLNCETDFVAKNESFIDLANIILAAVVLNNPSSNESLESINLSEDITIGEKIIEQTGVIGEKLTVSLDLITSHQVGVYMHPGNKLATIVGFSNEIDEQVRKDIAMQIAAMNPIALDRESVPQSTIDKELEIGKSKALEEGKPENILEKIAMGRLNKFFKENTLVEQSFIKDSNKTVQQYLNESSKGVKIVDYIRVGLGV